MIVAVRWVWTRLVPCKPSGSEYRSFQKQALSSCSLPQNGFMAKHRSNSPCCKERICIVNPDDGQSMLTQTGHTGHKMGTTRKLNLRVVPVRRRRYVIPWQNVGLPVDPTE